MFTRRAEYLDLLQRRGGAGIAWLACGKLDLV
jgi:hypothetical protein